MNSSSTPSSPIAFPTSSDPPGLATDMPQSNGEQRDAANLAGLMMLEKL
jgi:hypothetical protein